jgi:hypothetical protein
MPHDLYKYACIQMYLRPPLSYITPLPGLKSTQSIRHTANNHTRPSTPTMTALPILVPTLSDIATLRGLIISQGRTVLSDRSATGNLDIVYIREPGRTCTAELVVYERKPYVGRHFLLYKGRATMNSYYEALEVLWNEVVAGTLRSEVEPNIFQGS